MGRGRQKAKYAKIARDLKYNTPSTNFDSLERELKNKGTATSTVDDWGQEVDYSEYAEKYADYYDDEDDEDEDD